MSMDKTLIFLGNSIRLCLFFVSLILKRDRNCWMLVRTILNNVMELYCIGMCNTLCWYFPFPKVCGVCKEDNVFINVSSNTLEIICFSFIVIGLVLCHTKSSDQTESGSQFKVLSERL